MEMVKGVKEEEGCLQIKKEWLKTGAGQRFKVERKRREIIITPMRDPPKKEKGVLKTIWSKFRFFFKFSTRVLKTNQNGNLRISEKILGRKSSLLYKLEERGKVLILIPITLTWMWNLSNPELSTSEITNRS